MKACNRNFGILFGCATNPVPSEKLLTTPNIITLTGILAILLYTLQIKLGMMMSVIPLTVLVVAFSDLVDGPLARYTGQQTRLGRLLDCLRDRLILVVAMGNIFAVKKNTLTIFLFLLIIVLELFSFLKKDIADLKRSAILPENRLIKTLYVITLCSALVMVSKIYWNINFLPSLWFFASVFLITAVAGFIQTLLGR